ncbi:MAG: dockerin type I domain-containing protein [Planctomycetota bacterium]
MDDDLPISDRFREALRDVATSGRLEVPETVDLRIRAAAHRPRGRLLRLRRVAVAAAAAVVLAVGAWALSGIPGDETPVAAGTGDIDADGVVDIVDAYLLDRRLASSPERGDLTGDGRVDAKDVLRLIEMVVSVGRRG